MSRRHALGRASHPFQEQQLLTFANVIVGRRVDAFVRVFPPLILAVSRTGKNSLSASYKCLYHRDESCILWLLQHCCFSVRLVRGTDDAVKPFL